MQVKVTIIQQVNLRYEAQSEFGQKMLEGTLKAMLKNSVTEFFTNWEHYLQRASPLVKRKADALNTSEFDYSYNELVFAGSGQKSDRKVS